MPIDSHLPQADPFSLVPTFNVRQRDIINRNRYGSTALLNTPKNVGFKLIFFNTPKNVGFKLIFFNTPKNVGLN
jgi:hypothetical protein